MTRRLLAITVAVLFSGLVASPAHGVPARAMPTGTQWTGAVSTQAGSPQSASFGTVSSPSAPATGAGDGRERPGPPNGDDRPWPPDRGKPQGPPWDVCRIVPFFCH